MTTTTSTSMDVADRRAQRLTLAGAILICALGLVLRLLGFFSLELWCDEAMWASRLVAEKEAGGAWIRPAGYLWLTRALVGIANNEPMVRSLSYVAGIALVPLSLLVCLRVASRGPALFGGLLIAVSPIAVAMTKEFKPYIVDAALHALLIALTIVASSPEARARTRSLAHAGALAVALLAPLFSWTTIFVYPALFSVLAWPDLASLPASASSAHSSARRRRLAATVAAAVATLALVAAAALSRVKTSDATADYWAQKHDVFFEAGRQGAGLLHYLLWVINKSAMVATFPARLDWSTTLWPDGANGVVAGVAMALSVALVALGIASLAAKRRFTHLALLVSPWAIALAFNLARKWPYGMFRTNTFLLFYTTVLVVVGVAALGELLSRVAPQGILRALALACVLALVPFQVEPYRHKGPDTLTGEASVRQLMERLRAIETAAGKSVDQRRMLVGDGHACRIFNYYRDVHDDGRAQLHDWYRAHFDVTCASGESRPRFERKLDEVAGKSFWMMTANPRLKSVARRRLAHDCARLRVEALPASTMLFRCEGAAPQARSGPSPR